MKKLHLLTLAFLATITVLHADTITSSDLISGFAPNTNESVALSSFDATLLAQGLNPADYSLTGVTLSFSETSQALVNVFNSSPSSVSFQAAAQSTNFNAALSVNNNVVATASSAPIYNGRVTVGAANPLTTVGVTSSTPAAVGSSTYAPSLPDGPVTASSSLAAILSAQLGSWVASTPSLTISTAGTFDSAATVTGPPGAGSQAFFGGTSTTDATVTATYSYEVAPEPSAWALMLVGFALLASRLRARRI